MGPNELFGVRERLQSDLLRYGKDAWFDGPAVGVNGIYQNGLSARLGFGIHASLFGCVGLENPICIVSRKARLFSIITTTHVYRRRWLRSKVSWIEGKKSPLVEPCSIGCTFNSGCCSLATRGSRHERICNGLELIWPSVDAHRPDARGDSAVRPFARPTPGDDRGI